MDHETRKLLQDYNDEFIKFKRYMEDALENIDFDNLSSRVRTAISMGGVSRSGFENEAGPDGAYARMFAEFKNEQSAALAEFRAQAMKNYATVEMVATYKETLDNQAETLAGFKAEVEKNYATAKMFSEWQAEFTGKDGAFGKLESSVASIETKADANGAAITELAEWKGVFTGIDGEFEQLKNSVAGVQKKANDNGAAIEEFAAWKDNFTAENGDFDTVLSEIKNIKEAAETYAKQEELTTFKKETVDNFTTAEQNAKEYTDGEIGKIGERITTVESSVDTLSEATDKYALKSDVTEFTSTVTQKFEDADTAAQGYADAAKAAAIADTEKYAQTAQNAAESAASAAENAANAKLEEHRQSWLETAQEKAQELANAAKTDAEDYADGKYTLIENSFTDIINKSDAQGAYINLMAGTIIGSVDADGNLYDEEGNPIAPGDIKVNAASVILDAAKDGATGIKLKANLIKLGAGASVDNYGNLYIKKLFGESNVAVTEGDVIYPGYFYAEMDSSADTLHEEFGADFLIKSVTPLVGTAGTLMYGFRYAITPGESDYSVNFVVGIPGSDGEKAVWGYNFGSDIFYPKGAWDFSSCEVRNLGVYFS